MNELKEYKREIPKLINIKRRLKGKYFDYKQCPNNIKTEINGSDDLPVHYS